MTRYIFFILIFFLGLGAYSQEDKEQAIVFYGMEHFLIEGTRIPVSDKESPFDRLPASYKDKVRPSVWNLSKSSAGIQVRFLSNSTRIKARWTLMNDNSMNHMADTGIKGVDLYFKMNGEWQYVNTGRPSGLDNEASLVSNMLKEMREYVLYLPLYDGVSSVEIGIDDNCEIIKPGSSDQKPIVFYGTSITQGGCASRPGMVHTSIVSRKLHVDCINFGFSGNGKMETELVELISGIDARIYVIECLPNMTVEQVSERTAPLVKLIRKEHPATPIVLVENFIYEAVKLDLKEKKEIEEKNIALDDQYKELKKLGVKELYYFNFPGPLGGSHEGTVDGVHFTDLGFQNYANYLTGKFKEHNLFR